MAVAAAVALGSTTAPAGAATTFTPGAPGVGDPYFPLEGNGGYDVSHYGLDLTYDPATHRLSATAHISARATQNLSRFDLDLSGLTVGDVVVDGTKARFDRAGQELRVTPRADLRSGAPFETTVRYDGSPETITGSPILGGSDYGWIYTLDGAAVGAEPDAARTWYPCNDHPSDKATFTFRVTVPSTRQVVANGELVSTTKVNRSTTYVWDETRPMATYLATVDIGRWVFRRGTTASGIPETVAADPSLQADVERYRTFTRTATITDYWASQFGTYPFTSTGAIVERAPRIQFSLETQTRPLYAFAPQRTTMAHELAHQWFGDSVSVRTWRDTWLNEGFATFAQGLWDEHTGRSNTYDEYRTLYDQFIAQDPFWQLPIADPGRDDMFGYQIYLRGAMTLAALRHRIGDTDFFALLRRWTTQYRYGNASTPDFVRLAEQVSGQDLSTFFYLWLYAKAKPVSFNAG